MTDFQTQTWPSDAGSDCGPGSSPTNSQTFSGAMVSTGTVAYDPFTRQYTYVAVLDTAAADISYVVNGTASKVGDVVNISTLTNGVFDHVVSYVFEGTYTNASGNAVDVFAPEVLGFVNLGQAIAIDPSNTSTTHSASGVHTLNRSAPAATCFLRGTMIATPFGEVAVEALAIGDLVETLVGDKMVAQTVTWIGNRRVHVHSGATAQDSAPVRIRANAVREGAPSRDLLVTPEHCLFIEGKFIPARMLVNGSSIVSDTSIISYEYFHVELAQHAVLIAEGLETESYLDTGNRSRFANSSVASLTVEFSVNADHKSWTTDAAAPLATDRDTVEPIWAALSARAATIGLEAAAQGKIDNEPALRLVAASGIVIDPTRIDGDSYIFTVPANAGALRLRSRTFRPSDAIGPFVDDRRTLGVFVGKIGLAVDGAHSDVTTHLVDAELAGWHPVEGTSRWTNGNALVPVDLSTATGPVTITFEIVTLGLYRTTPVVAVAA